MIKSHPTITADRATIAEKTAPGIRVLGGLALNSAVGGLNPAAVEAAITLGARQIWMPTSSAAQHIAFYRQLDPSHISQTTEGMTILQGGKLVPAVHEVLRLIAHADIILGTGHL